MELPIFKLQVIAKLKVMWEYAGDISSQIPYAKHFNEPQRLKTCLHVFMSLISVAYKGFSQKYCLRIPKAFEFRKRLFKLKREEYIER